MQIIIAPHSIASSKERYKVLLNSDNYMCYLDTQTIAYAKHPYIKEQLIDAWIKTIRTDGSYTLERYYFRIKERKMQQICSVTYDDNGNQISVQTYTYDEKNWINIIPETLGEKWYNSITKFAFDNDELLKSRN
jgi:hypothetical protein